MNLTLYESDLFFNLDHPKMKGKDGKLELDNDKMRAEAEWFAHMIQAIGGRTLDTDSILEDFNGRV